MLTARSSWFTALGLVALAAPTFATQESALAPERAAIVETAQRYATVSWRAEERHILHGEDAAGVRVDTPDVTLDESGWRVGEGNLGMPYCWGGFTSLEGLEAGLAQGRYAGHVPNKGNAASSRQTLGVDCSGLVSRCWNLPVKQSTRSLGALCYELDDYADLEPGDIVNRFDSHVALFTGWVDAERTEMRVIEAARIKVEASTYSVKDLRSRDFRPMRYKLLDARWQAMPRADLDEPRARSLKRGFVLTSASPERADPLPAALRAGDPRPGDWARYDATVPGGGVPVTSTWMAVSTATGPGPLHLELQRQLDVGQDSLATGTTLPLGAEWHALLVAVGDFSNPLDDLQVITSSIDAGAYRLGDRELPARRVTGRIEGRMLSRSTFYPVAMELECVLSDEVPLLGICELHLKLEIDYGTPGSERSFARAERHYRLLASGRKELGGAR